MSPRIVSVLDQANKTSQETIDVFYHGFDNYMEHAYPEDELRPVSCGPLTRDRANPAHIELNDVLGNISLTLIDSLSTLAILASSPHARELGRSPLHDFQAGVKRLVEQYGDGTKGMEGYGRRARGFDVDSKVQVFETVIRGVGGLVSAHLFAVGELPITTYDVHNSTRSSPQNTEPLFTPDILWHDDFVYNGQLLRLAVDLANRLLPAFSTSTGLPYPRVNLRWGVPFYPNSPLNGNIEQSQCVVGSPEITETCSAGAGSLVLEFTTLSRLSGDSRFEILSKKAFEAVWVRRSTLGLIGAGIDAETGIWVAPFSGVGAGIDSFFEYALKSHILMSRTTENETAQSYRNRDPDFLEVWKEAHAAIKRHLYKGSPYLHPHYVQGDLFTGATRAFWIDSLSAYYPGLLTLGGELDEAIETHLLYTALWTRYSALPERWSTASGNIDSGLRWWGGRPEFIESTWYIYRATHDPWYLHVGEMALRDIKRRCWTECGWAGLEDVRSGELKDRMESFFLGETVKYLYLLFDEDHPLNKLDAPFVFTTEGHPVILPASTPTEYTRPQRKQHQPLQQDSNEYLSESICPCPPAHVAFSISATTARADFFHAACLARLHQIEKPIDGELARYESSHDNPRFHDSLVSSPNNHTTYPWTLPASHMPPNGVSSRIEQRLTFDLSFPTFPNAVAGPLTLRRLSDGVMIVSVSSLKLSMSQESAWSVNGEELVSEKVFRVHAVAHINLGRNEKVYITSDATSGLNPVDTYFTRHRDVHMLDVVVESTTFQNHADGTSSEQSQNDNARNVTADTTVLSSSLPLDTSKPSFLQNILYHLSSVVEQHTPLESILNVVQQRESHTVDPRIMLGATIATGVGSGTIPDIVDSTLQAGKDLPWTSIYIGDELCDHLLPASVPQQHQIIVLRRGGCSFAAKLKNIPSFLQSSSALQLVILVTPPEHDTSIGMIRPLVDQVQYTPTGMPRFNPIPMVMIEGDEKTEEMLRYAKGIGLRRRYYFSSQGLRINNLHVI